jgi:rhodanese-related sulfurtransferase
VASNAAPTSTARATNKSRRRLRRAIARMVPCLAMRGLVRDTVLLVVVTMLLGTAANLVPGRQLAWWGKGHEPPQAGADFNFLDPGSADAMRTSLPGIVFLDTRSATDFAAGHVPGAERISYTDLQAELTPERLGRLRSAGAIIIYGASEETDVEQLLAQELHRRGLAPPYVLIGGFLGWQGSGLPVDGGAR